MLSLVVRHYRIVKGLLKGLKCWRGTWIDEDWICLLWPENYLNGVSERKNFFVFSPEVVEVFEILRLEVKKKSTKRKK